MDPKLLQAARQLVTEAIVAAARSDVEEASGWIVICQDEESGRYHATGPYPTPEAALVEAGIQNSEVNADLAEGEAGWSHTVAPLFAPRP